MLAAARRQLTRREPEYSAHVCVTLRRAVHLALARLAPTKQVAAWSHTRVEMRGDGKAPTIGSQVAFALRHLPRSLSKVALAQVLVVDGIMSVVNGPIHLDLAPSEPVILDLMVDQVEHLLLLFAEGDHLGSTSTT